MARALDALARANVEVLALSSSSYRQSFCFLVRNEELERTLEALESALALELAHGYLKPDRGGRRTSACWRWWAKACAARPGSPAASSRRSRASDVNIIAIAQGSSELTIAIVVRATAWRRPCGRCMPNAAWA